jgi:hypothetical protein
MRMAISPGKAIISIARALLSVRFQTSRSRPTFGGRRGQARIARIIGGGWGLPASAATGKRH